MSAEKQKEAEIKGPQKNTDSADNYEEKMMRIAQKDIEGKMSAYSGFTKIKGVSWAMANAACKKLGIDKKRKIGSLSQTEIKKIEEFLRGPDIPNYLKNRQRDFDDGTDKHLIGTELDLRKSFDLKRLKKIKSYRGYRHIAGLPVRGQRTKAHFRKHRAKSTGIKRKRKPFEASSA